MNILVTGSEGFIGKHLVERLKLDGHKVEGWDIVDGQDTCDTSLSPSKKLDAIFHLACPVDPGNYKEVALDTIRASVLGTMNILKLAVNNSAKFLYVSSSEVYGEQKKRDFKEDDLSIIDPCSIVVFCMELPIPSSSSAHRENFRNAADFLLIVAEDTPCAFRLSRY